MNSMAIYRAERFSPNSVDRDKAIMDAVCGIMGCSDVIREEDIGEYADRIRRSALVLSMARSEEALRILGEAEKGGAVVVNSAAALANCSRSSIDRKMRDNNLPAAPLSSEGGWWIKRGDEAAQNKCDVRFAADSREKELIIKEFRERGVNDLVVTAHVDGDLVKFYGVKGTGFFHTSYPTDGHFSKFGDERRNGTARHTPFNAARMAADAERLAKLTDIDVYGGDCIVSADGSYAIIDFNDWPSFSCCRDMAARAIASAAERKLKEK